ncbi:MAG: hypothetical protein ABIJ96_08610 [Elusimicrobiota bacterium]
MTKEPRDTGRLTGGLLFAVLFIVAAQFISFRLFIFDTGFYNDDWVSIARYLRADSIGGVFREFAAYKQVWTRPIGILLYPLQYTLTGGAERPFAGQLILLLFDAVESVLFLLVMLRLTRSRRFSLAAALFMSLFPNRAVTHFWMVLTPQPLGHILVLTSFLLHWDGLEARRFGRLAAAQLCYVLGALCYESAMLTPLLLFAAILHDQASRRELPAALWESVKRMAPYGASFLLVVGWQRWGIMAFLDWENPKEIAFSASHFFKAFGAGFECVTNRVLHICALAAPEAWRNFGASYWLLWGLLVIFVGEAVYRADGFADSPRVRPGRAGLMIAALFVGSYAPYALSGSYMPQIFGIMSRTNGTGAWVGGMLLAWLFEGLLRLRPKSDKVRFVECVLAASIVGAFTWTNGQAARDYAESWKLQRSVLAGIARHSPDLPDNSVVLLKGVPRQSGRAVVFDASYDFDYALRCATGRAHLSGRLMSPDTRYEADGFVLADFGFERKFAYDKLYFYDYPRDVLERVTPP